MSKFAIRRERERKCNKEKYSQEIIIIKIYKMKETGDRKISIKLGKQKLVEKYLNPYKRAARRDKKVLI